MGRVRGLFEFAASFEPYYAEPLDGRSIVEKVSDLVSPEVWTAPDGNAYTFVGMRVSVVNDGNRNGIYWLAHPDYTSLDNWKPVGSGGAASQLRKFEFYNENIISVNGVTNHSIIQVYKSVEVPTNILYGEHRFGEVTFSQEIDLVYELVDDRIIRYNPLSEEINIILQEILSGVVLIRY